MRSERWFSEEEERWPSSGKEVVSLPGFDGTGPLGRGPLTGRGMGFCVVKFSGDAKARPPAEGLAGRGGQQTDAFGQTAKEVSKMPVGNGTGPLGLGPMTGRAAGYCAGYPVPGFMNPMVGMGVGPRSAHFGGVPAYGPAGLGVYSQSYPAHGYGAPYGGGYGFPFARRFGRGFGFGRGRGRW